MRKRMAIRAGHAAGNTCMAIVLAIGAVALAVLPGEVSGQRSTTTTTAEQSPPMFTAIDLTSRGFQDAHASGISGEQQVGDAYLVHSTRDNHALLWRGSAASVIDLHPGGFEKSEAHGICGGQQVGQGTAPGTRNVHALLWRGSAGSVVDLTPSGFDAVATATSGDQQVGSGSRLGSNGHALLWRGGAASVIDLHPRGFEWSLARGVSGGQQVGVGSLPSTVRRTEHALLWRGSAASVVDLHPSGFAISTAWGVGGGQQVGNGEVWEPGGNRTMGTHALLWRGSAASVVDLTPSGGIALATNGEEQVGRGGNHAVLWRGSATSAVDLHVFLPPRFQFSQAFGIDVNGDVVGEASPTGGPADDSHAFLWRRNVPKPASQQSMGQCK